MRSFRSTGPSAAAGKTKNNFFTLFDFALSSLAGSSKSLLRVPLSLGIIVAVLTALAFLATIIGSILGWSMAALLAIATLQLGIFAVLLVFLGLMGEQIRMISERGRNVPLVNEAERVNFPPDRQLPSGRTFVGAADPKR